MIKEIYTLYVERWRFFLSLTGEHLQISLVSIAVAAIIGYIEQPLPEKLVHGTGTHEFYLHDTVDSPVRVSDPVLGHRQHDSHYRSLDIRPPAHGT